MADRKRRGQTASHTSGTRRRTAPTGIKIYCVLAALGGLYALVLSLGILGAGGSFTVLGLLVAALAVGYFVVIYGLWTLEPWGWTWGMILFTLDLLVDLLRADVVGVLISALLLAYLASKRSLYRP